MTVAKINFYKEDISLYSFLCLHIYIHIYAEDFPGYYSLWRCRPKHFSSPSYSTLMLASQEIVSSICIFLTSHNVVGVLIFLYMWLFYALMKVLKHVSSFRVSLPIESIMVRSSLLPPQQLNFTKLFLISTGFNKWKGSPFWVYGCVSSLQPTQPLLPPKQGPYKQLFLY
jgi:hypothetical protein